MFDAISFISFIIFMFSFVFIGIKTVKLRNANIKLKTQIIELIQKNELLTKSLSSKENITVEKTEGFLNFVTQSRDWAFEYIEDVQRVINKVIQDTELIVSYHKEFRSLAIEPYQSQLDLLIKSVEELKFLLPNEEFFK